MNNEEFAQLHDMKKKEPEIYKKSRNYDDQEENADFELNQMVGEDEEI